VEDLARLLGLIQSYNGQGDDSGFDTIYDVVVNKSPFDISEHDLIEAHDVCYDILHTLFEIEFKDEMVFGKPRLSMERLFGDLINLLERIEHFKEEQANQWPNP